MKVQREHVCRYSTETIVINTRNDLALKAEKQKNVHTMNYLIGLTVLIPLLAILSICGGNIMLTILIVLALIPLGYLFVKFF